MTKKLGRSADNDPSLAPILNANTKAVCIVGKSWDFHVDVALGITKQENLENIKETAKYFINLGIMKHRLKSDISVVSEAVSG
jgi:2-isopropylmalate synthase